MYPIRYVDRLTGRKEIEKVYGERAIAFLYGDDCLSKLLGWPLLHSLVKTSLFSALYGTWQKLPLSKTKIKPFIKDYHVDTSEFLDEVDSYRSFNDFFIRKLKPEKRPIAPGKDVAVMPADGRYYFYQDISKTKGFVVKDQKFDIGSLIQDETLAKRYANGSMLIARLCPTDYHRFHFPCDCIPGPTKFINGWLNSVNPLAIKQNLEIFTQNKRAMTKLQTENFGEVLYLEIGATNVGSIKETYTPNVFQPKGVEKGYFEFGASALILLFEPNRIHFDQDLLSITEQGLEAKCLMGQPLGKSHP